MLIEACPKKIQMVESQLQSSKCKIASRPSSKLKAQTAPPFCRTSQNCWSFSNNKTRDLRLTDSEVSEFLQKVLVHGTTYTFSDRVFQKSIFPLRSILFQPKKMQHMCILVSHEVFHSVNERPSDFTDQFNFCKSKCRWQKWAQERKGTSWVWKSELQMGKEEIERIK